MVEMVYRCRNSFTEVLALIQSMAHRTSILYTVVTPRIFFMGKRVMISCTETRARCVLTVYFCESGVSFNLFSVIHS